MEDAHKAARPRQVSFLLCLKQMFLAATKFYGVLTRMLPRGYGSATTDIRTWLSAICGVDQRRCAGEEEQQRGLDCSFAGDLQHDWSWSFSPRCRPCYVDVKPWGWQARNQ